MNHEGAGEERNLCLVVEACGVGEDRNFIHALSRRHSSGNIGVGSRRDIVKDSGRGEAIIKKEGISNATV